MIDINFIRENSALFKKLMLHRNTDVSVEKILNLDSQRKQITSSLQSLQTERNNNSRLIGDKKKQGEDTKILEKKVFIVKNKMLELEKSLKKVSSKLNEILLKLPNMPHKDVPLGKDDSFNKVIAEKFNKPSFSFKPLSHDEICKDLIDFEAASNISGARFVILKSGIAELERALNNFMIELHVEQHGYTEISAPHIVKSPSLVGTGQLPKFEEDLFSIGNDKWLIPTAEVTLTNLFRNKIIVEKNLPLRFVAQSNCFRSEAGAAGKDTKGMIRLHEFKKVELVSLVNNNQSDDELERLLMCATKVLDLLKLPYRVVLLSSGDMGFSASKTYDIEVWLPSQEKYREISSCSNCNDFQARRMNTKFKNINDKKEYIHTLNGSGLAIGRTLLAILENYQISENKIRIPEVLTKYMNGKTEISL